MVERYNGGKLRLHSLYRKKKLRKVASSDTIYVIIYRIELINREQIQTYRSGDKYERKSEKIDDSFFFLFFVKR